MCIVYQTFWLSSRIYSRRVLSINFQGASPQNFSGQTVLGGGILKKNEIRVVISIISVSQCYSTTKTYCKINLEDFSELYFFLGKSLTFQGLTLSCTKVHCGRKIIKI